MNLFLEPGSFSSSNLKIISDLSCKVDEEIHKDRRVYIAVSVFVHPFACLLSGSVGDPSHDQNTIMVIRQVPKKVYLWRMDNTISSGLLVVV